MPDPRSPLDAIVLAAGASRRFGGRKLLAPFENRPLILAALDAAFGAPARAVIVVIGRDEALAQCVRDHAQTHSRERDLRLLVVETADEGMGASLRTAAEAVSPDAKGVYVFLGDMPCVPATASRRLAGGLAHDTDIVAPRHAGQRGHPVLFGSTWLPALRASKGDAGARAVFAQAGARIRYIDDLGDGVVFDVDHASDLQRRSQP